MKAIIRKFRLVLVNKYSFYIYPTLTIISTICLIYCVYSSGCFNQSMASSFKANQVNNEYRRNVRDLNKLNHLKIFECYLFLLIISAPKGVTQRKAMRETWLTLRDSKHSIKRKFVIGTKKLSKATLSDLQKEQAEHSDLLFLIDFVDMYDSLSEKLLKSLVWVSENINTKFVMKLDDDSFVQLDLILTDLEKRENLGRLYWGFFRGNANIKRIGPWAENNWFLSDHYLPYALGGGYILSIDLVEYISKISGMVQLYKNEDVSLGKNIYF